jgi:hypothetical protein
MRTYPLADDLLGPLRRVAMPRPPRRVAPGARSESIADCEFRIAD